jgi:hypothetical protein
MPAGHPLLASVGFMPAGPRLLSYIHAPPPIPFFRPLGGRMGIELGPALVAVSSASARDEPDGRLHAGGAKTLELHPCTPLYHSSARWAEEWYRARSGLGSC